MLDKGSLVAGGVVLGPDVAEAELVVIGVHGRDQTPAYLVDHLVDPIDDRSIAWLLPAAPRSQWWPSSFMDDRSANEPHMSAAVARIEAVADGLADVESERIVWLGFSQGACLVSEVVARRPRRWAALIVLSGGRVGPPGTEMAVAGDLGAMPVHVSCGARDPWVPVRRVEETAAAFGAAGATVTVSVFDDAEHCIRPVERAAVAALLAAAKRRPGTSG